LLHLPSERIFNSEALGSNIVFGFFGGLKKQKPKSDPNATLPGAAEVTIPQGGASG
jgi:hypothetical protein